MPIDEGGASSLEQFTLLAKNARGRACVALIQQALSNKKLFVFRELLDMPTVTALKETEHEGFYKILEIFAYGCYCDYMAKKGELPPLQQDQILKLRKLTVVSLAKKYQVVPYDVLMKELGITVVRELEDVLIETIYAGLVQGKLDQKSNNFVIKSAAGRDIQQTDLDKMIAKLSSWQEEATNICTNINNILSTAEVLSAQEKNIDDAILLRYKSIPSLEDSEMGFGSMDMYNEDFEADSLYGARMMGQMRSNSTRQTNFRHM